MRLHQCDDHCEQQLAPQEDQAPIHKSDPTIRQYELHDHETTKKGVPVESANANHCAMWDERKEDARVARAVQLSAVPFCSNLQQSTIPNLNGLH